MWITKQKYLNLKDKADRHNLLMDDVKSEFNKERASLNNQINDTEKKLTAANKENRELKKLVRKQTSADLLIIGLKAVGIIPEESKKEHDYAAEQKQLLERYNLYAQTNYQNHFYPNSDFNYLGSLANALGSQRQF
jgi:hypothetical protein